MGFAAWVLFPALEAALPITVKSQQGQRIQNSHQFFPPLEVFKRYFCDGRFAHKQLTEPNPPFSL